MKTSDSGCAQDLLAPWMGIWGRTFFTCDFGCGVGVGWIGVGRQGRKLNRTGDLGWAWGQRLSFWKISSFIYKLRGREDMHPGGMVSIFVDKSETF